MGASLITVEEYLRSTAKPNCEYRDGVLYPKALATTDHGILQGAVGAALYRLGLRVAVELTVKLAPTKYLVPDVAAAHVLQNPYPTEPVLLCCEILSPQDSLVAMLAKCEEYHAWGVPFCWVIDPVKRTAWEHHAAAEPMRVNSALRAGEYSVDLAELFSTLD
jgi:Uma2 family endonuclease